MLSQERKLALATVKAARSLAQSSAAACRLQRQPEPAVEMVRPLAEAVERLAEIVALLVEEHH
jgi:hypothetical protein